MCHYKHGFVVAVIYNQCTVYETSINGLQQLMTVNSSNHQIGMYTGRICKLNVDFNLCSLSVFSVFSGIISKNGLQLQSLHACNKESGG